MRDADGATLAHISGPLVRPFLCVDLDYPSGPVRVSSLPYDVTVDSVTYLGRDQFGALTDVTEGAESKSYSVTGTIAGIPLSYLEYLVGQKVQGRMAKVLLGFVNDQHRVIGTPTVLFVGRMDTQDINAGSSLAVSVALESLFIEWDRARTRRWTDVDQRSQYPEDVGLQYVATVANQEIVWGRA